MLLRNTLHFYVWNKTHSFSIWYPFQLNISLFELINARNLYTTQTHSHQLNEFYWNYLCFYIEFIHWMMTSTNKTQIKVWFCNKEKQISVIISNALKWFWEGISPMKRNTERLIYFKKEKSSILPTNFNYGNNDEYILSN